MKAVAAIAVALAWPVVARADDAAGSGPDRLLDDKTFAVDPPGALVIDAGMITGLASALPSGLASGVSAGVEHRCTCWLSYGARLAWDEISASNEVYSVTDQELRVRATVALRHDAGRGTLELRLGAGTNVVYEDRTRNGGQRAGLTGSALETREYAALPATDLEAVIGLRIAGAWRFIASGGPSGEVLDGAARGGWIAELGVGWQP